MERIKVLRERLGLSQIEFSRALGVTQATVSRWEREDVKSLSSSAAILIEGVFNVSPDWLAGKDVPMFITDKTSDAAPKVSPYAFFLSQGFGKTTARAFAMLCEMDKENKEILETACREKDRKTLDFIFHILRLFITVARNQGDKQGIEIIGDAPNVGGEEYDGDDAPIID